MRDVIALALVTACALGGGCAVSRAPKPANDPASASAPTGRLAGPPPSLRAGVVEYKDVPATRKEEPTPHHHHHGG